MLEEGADSEVSEFSPPTFRQERSELCTPYSISYTVKVLHVINLLKAVFP